MTKIKVWIKRYFLPEIIGTLGAVFAGSAVHFLTKSEVLTAFAGTWGENIGFYITIIAKDVIDSMRAHRSNQLVYGIKSFTKDLSNIFIEFGPSELFDSFITRPFSMYIFPTILNNLVIGIIAGKIAADILFYIPAIIGYELRKKYLG